ncbi:3-mercaptopropionate dioxygenase (fragment) [Paraburkholderia dioscoreae]|jgi:3-mercaptopropionate dioxygenase|uniref:3-mercaptopropionate dioxygenase n=2 Tax=Paraburkholderia dioscoreae TaxID=2604047 RepID=A0A5Q4ZC89_9BURK
MGLPRGAEIARHSRIAEDGVPQENHAAKRLDAGSVDAVPPGSGDIHRVRNVFGDRTSIGIHVYGANIGAVKRSVQAGGAARKLLSPAMRTTCCRISGML